MNAIILSQQAQETLINIVQWHKDQHESLAEHFLDDLNVLMDSTSRFPRQNLLQKAHFRYASMPNFPFVMVYEVQKKNIYVYKFFTQIGISHKILAKLIRRQLL